MQWHEIILKADTTHTSLTINQSLTTAHSIKTGIPCLQDILLQGLFFGFHLDCANISSCYQHMAALCSSAVLSLMQSRK
jgi:hypothetical protein